MKHKKGVSLSDPPPLAGTSEESNAGSRYQVVAGGASFLGPLKSTGDPATSFLGT